MGRSTLMKPSQITKKRLISGLTISCPRRTKRRTSQEIKLQVVDTFRGAIKVRPLIEADPDDDSENERASNRNRYDNYNHKKSKIGWWEPPMECLPLDFCRDTSLHGLKYIGQPKRHMAERVFWFLTFLVAVCAAAYLSSDVWRKYKESPVIVTFEPSETNIDKIPFPAVTICNMNKVIKQNAENYIKKAEEDLQCSSLKDVYNLDHVCTSTKSFSKRFNFTSSQKIIDKDLVAKAYACINTTDTSQNAIQTFLQKASQSCGEMIPLCIWHDKIIENCTTLFRPIETDFGKCCTFNMVPQTLLRVFQNDTRDDEEEIKKWSEWNAAEGGLFPNDESTKPRIERPRRQIRAGKSFGLSILLDPDLDQYYCTTSDSTGFRLSIHLPTETPHIIDFGLGLNSNSEVFVDVRPEITGADPSILNYDKDKRQCYFPGEIGLRFYNYYTVANCIDECVANVTFETCNCTRFYMPRDNNQKLCGPDVECVDKVQSELADAGIKTKCDYCLPPCTEINYVAETTTTPMQNGASTWMYENFINGSAKWSGNSVSVVHIYFGTDSTYARVRKQLYGVTDLIANTGGLMGLCLGFSGLSFVEIIYFLSLRAWCRTRRKRTLGSRVAQKFRDLWKKIKAVNTYGHEKESHENSAGQKKFGSQRQQNRVLPTVSISEYANPTFQNKVFTTTGDNNLPDYNSVINEINPYYTNRYWRHMDINSKL